MKEDYESTSSIVRNTLSTFRPIDEDSISKRMAIVEKFNQQWKETNYRYCMLRDGEIIRWNSNWIMDSEYMNFVYDNTPSTRIKEFLKN